MNPLKFRRVWTFVGYCWVALVVVLSLSPVPPTPVDFPGMDKVLHVLIYAALMLWFVQLHPKSRYGWLASGFIALGILLEVLQSWSGYRTGDVMDVLANSLGTVLSWGLAARGMNTLFRQFENLILKPEKEG